MAALNSLLRHLIKANGARGTRPRPPFPIITSSRIIVVMLACASQSTPLHTRLAKYLLSLRLLFFFSVVVYGTRAASWPAGRPRSRSADVDVCHFQSVEDNLLHTGVQVVMWCNAAVPSAAQQRTGARLFEAAAVATCASIRLGAYIFRPAAAHATHRRHLGPLSAYSAP